MRDRSHGGVDAPPLGPTAHATQAALGVIRPAPHGLRHGKGHQLCLRAPTCTPRPLLPSAPRTQPAGLQHDPPPARCFRAGPGGRGPSPRCSPPPSPPPPSRRMRESARGGKLVLVSTIPARRLLPPPPRAALEAGAPPLFSTGSQRPGRARRPACCACASVLPPGRSSPGDSGRPAGAPGAIGGGLPALPGRFGAAHRCSLGVLPPDTCRDERGHSTPTTLSSFS